MYGSLFEQNYQALTQGYFVLSFLDIVPVVLEIEYVKDFLNEQTYE